jgi:hypothetical protein
MVMQRQAARVVAVDLMTEATDVCYCGKNVQAATLQDFNEED